MDDFNGCLMILNSTLKKKKIIYNTIFKVKLNFIKIEKY